MIDLREKIADQQVENGKPLRGGFYCLVFFYCLITDQSIITTARITFMFGPMPHVS